MKHQVTNMSDFRKDKRNGIGILQRNSKSFVNI